MLAFVAWESALGEFVHKIMILFLSIKKMHIFSHINLIYHQTLGNFTKSSNKQCCGVFCIRGRRFLN